MAPPEGWAGSEIRLDREETHHAVNVLRVASPDVVTVADGNGRVARCSVARLEGDTLVAEILEVVEHRRLRPEVVVYQGAAKGKKLDDAFERLAELGIGQFWAFGSARSVVEWDRNKTERVVQRWQALARSGAKVARSPFTTDVGGVLSWTELLRRIAQETFSVVLWEEASLPMRTAFVGEPDRIALVVGPEGGLERAEAEALADAGGQLVSLGPRIFRTENASVVAVSALLFHFGLIG
ncbi:MAG: 16S rRNA (uracil(1498)-N(3))-methyltransferase [Actinomycetota bacterium]|nr:16S rRNA (uracil(1498)-N(3))-methyltransferase [Actinomycetota bacterium]